MTGTSPLCSTSFGNSSSPRLFPRSFSMRFCARRCSAGSSPETRSSSRQRPVPQLQRVHLAEFGHRLAVAARRGHGHAPGHLSLRLLSRQATTKLAPEALDVPLPRRRQRLVEVVDREDHAPLRRGEPAEVAQVRVTAALDPDPETGVDDRSAAIARADSAVEGERRADHAAVAQREEFGHPTLLGRQHRVDGVRPLGRRLPGRMGLAGTSRAAPCRRRRAPPATEAGQEPGPTSNALGVALSRMSPSSSSRVRALLTPSQSVCGVIPRPRGRW